MRPIFSNPGDNPARMSTIQSSVVTIHHSKLESGQRADRGNATRSDEDTDTDQRLGPYTAKAIHGGGPVALGCAALVLPPCKQATDFAMETCRQLQSDRRQLSSKVKTAQGRLAHQALKRI